MTVAGFQVFIRASRPCGRPCPSGQHRRVGCSATRREGLQAAALLALLQCQSSRQAFAAEKKEAKPTGPITSDLCDVQCAQKLGERTKLPSGLEYQDIVEGKGAKPVVGYQVVVQYVAMSPEGKVFDSSFEKNKTYDIRVGTGAVIPGLDEGLRTMRSGGIRRLYIPGNLSFPKGLPAAAGRPRVPPSSPVVFDVSLLYIPGFDDADAD